MKSVQTDRNARNAHIGVISLGWASRGMAALGAAALGMAAFAGGLFGGAGAVSAAPFLNLDFQNSSGANQSGFLIYSTGAGTAALQTNPQTQSFAVSDPSVTASSVSITTTTGTTRDSTSGELNGTPLFGQNRGTLSGASGITFGNIYQDFVFAQGTPSPALGLEISGLNASTAYVVTLYGYDNNVAHTITFSDITNGATGPTVGATYTTGTGHTFASNTDYAVTGTLTTDSLGRLFISEAVSGAGNTSSPLDGLQISAATPEPTSLALAAVGGMLLLRRRRRTSPCR